MNNDLAAEHINLAYKLAWDYSKKFYSKIELEDLQSVCFIGLTKAAKEYDASKNFEFSTFAYAVMKNEVLRYIQKNLNKSTVSLSHQLTEDLTLEDTLQSDFDLEDVANTNLKISKLYSFIDELNVQEQNILKYTLKGLNIQQIAKILGIPVSTARTIYKKSINKLRYRFMKEGEFGWGE